MQGVFVRGWPAPVTPDDRSPKEFRDFLKRLDVAEAIKQEMRRKYARASRSRYTETFETMTKRAKSFWAEYEEVNRLWVPEDPVYSGSRTGITLATTTDAWTLSSPSVGQVRALEAYWVVDAAASTVVRIEVQRSTVGRTPTN